jgi:hypothetical protein
MIKKDLGKDATIDLLFLVLYVEQPFNLWSVVIGLYQPRESPKV